SAPLNRRESLYSRRSGTAPANSTTIRSTMSSHPTSTCRAFSIRRAGLALLIPFVFASSMARAQDAIRPSLAGEAAAEARRQEVDHIPYNLLLGPVRFRVSATM